MLVETASRSKTILTRKNLNQVTNWEALVFSVTQTNIVKVAPTIIVITAVVVLLSGCAESNKTATTSKTETTHVSNSRQLEKPYFVLLADDICKGHDLAVKKLKLHTASSTKEAVERHKKLVPVFKDTVDRFDQIGYPSGDSVTIAFAYVDEWRKSYESHTLALEAARVEDKAELSKQEVALERSLKKRGELARDYGFSECQS